MPAAVEYIQDQSSGDYRALEEAHAKEYDSRAALFARHWDYYKGNLPEPLKREKDGYNDNVILAKIDQLADKTVSFLLGDGITFNAGDGANADDPTDQALAELWRANRGQLLQHKMGLNGSIAGHVAVRIEVRPGNLPRIVALNPAQVSVFWDEADFERILWYRLQYRLGTFGSGKRVDYVSGAAIRDGNPDAWYEYTYAIDGNSSHWSLLNTKPIEYCPIVDWQNMPLPSDYYGKDDISKALRINDALNFVLSDYQRILKHHGHPRTIGVGMEAADVHSNEIGGFFTVNKPATEAQIYNLEMQSDLSSAREFANLLMAEIWQSGRMVDPATMKDKVGDLTNFGLRLLYGDALQKTETKRLLYQEGFEAINKTCLALMGLAVPEQIATVWPDPLPSDDAALSAAKLAEVQAGLISKQTARDSLGYDHEAEEERIAEEQAGQDTLGMRLLGAFEKGA